MHEAGNGIKLSICIITDVSVLYYMYYIRCVCYIICIILDMCYIICIILDVCVILYVLY